MANYRDLYSSKDSVGILEELRMKGFKLLSLVVRSSGFWNSFIAWVSPYVVSYDDGVWSSAIESRVQKIETQYPFLVGGF